MCAGVTTGCGADEPAAADGPSGIAVGAVVRDLGSGKPRASASARPQTSSGVAACRSPSLARTRKASPATRRSTWLSTCGLALAPQNDHVMTSAACGRSPAVEMNHEASHAKQQLNHQSLQRQLFVESRKTRQWLQRFVDPMPLIKGGPECCAPFRTLCQGVNSGSAVSPKSRYGRSPMERETVSSPCSRSRPSACPPGQIRKISSEDGECPSQYEARPCGIRRSCLIVANFQPQPGSMQGVLGLTDVNEDVPGVVIMLPPAAEILAASSARAGL